MSRKRIIIWIANVVTVLAVGGYYFANAGDPLLDEYPDSPYTPLDADAPRIIVITEAPLKADKQAYDAYWDRRRAVTRWSLEEGALSQATPDEQEAYRLANSEEDYAASRELVVEILADHAASVPGRFALATIEHKGEGNFPRAIFLMRKLRHELHDTGVADPDNATNREWYIRVCYAEWNMLYDLKRDEEGLRLMTVLEQVYQPMPWRRVWQLSRLGRFDEGREAIDAATAAGGWEQQVAHFAAVIANGESKREGAYLAGKNSVEVDPESAVVWSNLSGYCRQDFRFDEAEEALLKSASLQVNFRGSAYTYLASTFAEQGQFTEAWNSLKKAQSQRLERDSYTLVMDQHEFDRRAAFVLFLLGHAEEACRLARRSFERPSRDYSSSDERDGKFEQRFSFWVMLNNRIHQLSESDDAAAEIRGLELDRWTLERQIIALLRDDDYLIRMLRPNMPGIPSPDTLFLPDVARLLPSGVAHDALARARAAEEHPSAVAYFDAVEAELHWADGNYAEALPFTESAIDGLDEYERCLRSRVAAVAGDCHRRLNQMDQALPLFEQAMLECPAVFRLLDLAIPLAIAEDGSPLAIEWASHLLDSPRFEGHPNGFVLVARTTDDELSFELFRTGNIRVCQGSTPAAGQDDRVLQAATRRLLARMMSPQLDLTSTDINSLDNGLFAAPKPGETARLMRLAAPGG